MSRTVDRLTEIVTPPQSAGIEVDWEEVARAVGTPVPADYVELIERYGGGRFDEYLWLLEPDARSYYDLTEKIDDREGDLEDLWDGGEAKPPQLEVPGARAIAWASTDNGEYLYWLAEEGREPEEWTVLVNEARGERWEHFEMGCAEFLFSSLTGDVRSELLWSRYPADPHKFESCGLYPRRDDDDE